MQNNKHYQYLCVRVYVLQVHRFVDEMKPDVFGDLHTLDSIQLLIYFLSYTYDTVEVNRKKVLLVCRCTEKQCIETTTKLIIDNTDAALPTENNTNNTMHVFIYFLG